MRWLDTPRFVGEGEEQITIAVLSRTHSRVGQQFLRTMKCHEAFAKSQLLCLNEPCVVRGPEVD